MPAALSHIFLRIVRTGLIPHPRRDPRYLLLYLPLFGLIPAERLIAADPLGWFLHRMALLTPYYIAWTSLICVATSIGLLIIRHRSRSPRDRRLFAGLALSLLLMTCILAWTLTLGQSMSDSTLAYLQLLALMAPLLPIALFSYFAIRFHFLRIVVARTLLYGGIVVTILLLHWLTLRSIGEQVERSYQIDFGVIEAIVIILVVLAIEPIRERIFESLRYLLRGESSADARERIRMLSISLLKHSGQTPSQRFDSFVTQLALLLRLRYAAGWLWNKEGTLIARSGKGELVSDACGRTLHHDLLAAEPAFIPLREMPTRKSLELMHSIEASAAIVFGEEGLHGLILLGQRERNTDFGEEESNALVLVAEQLAAAIHADQWQLARHDAERRALQHEKLSMIGLTAGSIMHEIKNPLSSINTIATVLAEELGPAHPNHQDVQIILAEIRRLTDSTRDILHFARPSSSSSSTSLRQVFPIVQRVLSHFARERSVRIHANDDGADSRLTLSDDQLQEILFNLIANAIRATPPNTSVEVHTTSSGGTTTIDIVDHGPGIEPAHVNQLFEPFVSFSDGGIGLGLYNVKRRTVEAGGTIAYSRTPDGRTLFRLTLPEVSE
jgi:signal transduction histidine kinase